MVGASGDVSGAGSRLVNSEYQGGDGVTTSGIGSGIGVGPSRVVVGSIPGVRQLVGAPGNVGGAGSRLVDGKYQGGDGIATSGIGSGVGISPSCIVIGAIPSVRQLVRAPGDVGSADRSLTNC